MCQITKILEIKDVTYIYDGERLPVWKHLSCVFFEGKIHAISGPSGCGKSSVLSLIDGLIPHMYEGQLEGQVILKGQDITDTLPRYRCDKIGYVMQNPESQFCTFTVEEELAFGMENLGFSEEEMRQRIRDILRFIGLQDYEKTELDHLSGGQKQKIAIASILVTEPEILLLDEPTANLDPENRRQIFNLLVKIAREKNITIILVEHNIDEIMNEVDWLITLDIDGNIISNCPGGKADEALWNSNMKMGSFSYPDDLSTPDCILDIKNLKFAYPIPGKKREKGKTILHDFNMKVFNQEFLAIVGENGVGKSTLMKLIFKVDMPDSGTIELFGKNLNLYHTKKLYHLIGLVFQNPENQFITNTVWDEMMFSLKRTKLSQTEKEERVQKMLEQFHLEKEKEKSPFILSQGQKRRLSVASMLLTNQKILFLDEPTYGQDFENRQELMKDMQQLVKDGITIVMITHDLSLVKQYATRVVEIEKGTVVRNLATADYFRYRREKEDC